MENFLLEVEREMKSHSRKVTGIPDVYKTKLKTYWVPTPLQRNLLKQGYSFSHLPHGQQKPIWKYIWLNSISFEGKQQALFYFQGRRDHPELIKDWPLIKGFAKDLENWAHSDVLSDIYARLLEREPQKIIPVLEKWNQSQNPWLKRQSLVSLFYYQRMRQIYPESNLVFKFLDRLKEDEFYYVQKAVGWTLREAYQVYQRETKSFIEENLHALSSIAFTTSMEKAQTSYKEKLKKIRAHSRTRP